MVSRKCLRKLRPRRPPLPLSAGRSWTRPALPLCLTHRHRQRLRFKLGRGDKLRAQRADRPIVEEEFCPSTLPCNDQMLRSVVARGDLPELRSLNSLLLRKGWAKRNAGGRVRQRRLRGWRITSGPCGKCRYCAYHRSPSSRGRRRELSGRSVRQRKPCVPIGGEEASPGSVRPVARREPSYSLYMIFLGRSGSIIRSLRVIQAAMRQRPSSMNSLS
jgi:hypothetical protein